MAGVPESRNRSSATQSSEMRELGTVIVCLLLVTCIQSEEEVSYETEERKPCTYFCKSSLFSLLLCLFLHYLLCQKIYLSNYIFISGVKILVKIS